MYTLFLAILLLVLLFHTAAATSPSLDPTLPAVPMESFYPDPDGMLNAVCEICGSISLCSHGFVTNPLQSGPDFIFDTYYSHPEWMQDHHSFAVAQDPEPQLSNPPEQFTTSAVSIAQPLYDTILQQLDDNATSVQSTTVLSHVEDTYTPGDRLAQSRGSQRSSKRQTPRKNGFPCRADGCQKTFNRACDVKRHEKTHLSHSERPYQCSYCQDGFLYPKDLSRHQTKHSPVQGTLYCTFPGCTSEGFSRRDNLRRHQKKQHPSSDTSS